MSELLKLAIKSGSVQEEKEQKELATLPAIQFNCPEDASTIPPLICIDGSYVFLFSVPGTETWITLFRISVTDYNIQDRAGKMHYCMNAPPKIVDHLGVLSFQKEVLARQPQVFAEAADNAANFSDRKQSVFAAIIMAYLEEKTLQKISITCSDCMLVSDKALVSYKALRKEIVIDTVITNCRANNILFGGLSKSTSSHFFNSFYTDDYYLKKRYDEQYQTPTRIPLPRKRLEERTQPNFILHGEVNFVKLHEHATKWFRLDIGNDNGDANTFCGHLAAYSKYHLLPGYPFGLIEAHKVAKSVRDFKQAYEMELIDTLKDLGLNAVDLLDGSVDLEGSEINSFHGLLDQLSRV